MLLSPRPATRRFTVDDVLRMADAGVFERGEKVELLEGELFVVIPQGPSHAGVATLIFRRLVRAYGDSHVVRAAMPLVAGGDSLPEPDLAVFRAGERDFLARHPAAQESALLVEIAVSSLPVDRAKAAIYARAGALEYWIVDVENRRLTVHQGPQSDGGYRLVRVLSDQESIAPPGTNESWHVSELLP